MTKYSPAGLLPLAQRTGRWAIKTVRARPCLYTTNLGSSIRFSISGSQSVYVGVLNNGHPTLPAQMYAWRVDAGDWHRVAATAGGFSVPLSDHSSHLIEVTCAGNTDFDQVWTGDEGFAITEITTTGQLHPAPKRPLVNFIGDSITAGCWITGKRAALDYRPESNYVGLASDRLGIDGVRIAYSAAGVLRPGTGGVPVAAKFLRRIDANTQWAINHPQLTVINLGVNDRRYAVQEFSLAYDNFIHQVITMFPTSRIAVLVPFSQAFRTAIMTIARHYNVDLIETAGWCTDYTDGLHPNQNGAQTAGRHLAAVLSKLLPSRRD